MANDVEARFSVLSALEGGIGQTEAIRQLTEVGLKAEPDHTPYVGCEGVKVIGTSGDIIRADKLLNG